MGNSLEERTVPEHWCSGKIAVDPWEWIPYFVNYRRNYGFICARKWKC